MKNMKRHLLLFALLIFSDIHILLAQSYVLPFEAGEFESIGSDAVYDPELYERDGTPVLSSSSPTAMQVGNIKGLIVLYIDPMDNTITENLDIDVTVSVSYKLFPYESASHEETIQLNVNYDPNAGTTYKNRDYHLIENAGWIQIETFEFDLNGYAQPIESLGGAIKFQLEIISDKYYLPVRTQKPEMQSTEVDRNDGYVRFKWKPLTWAKYYDVEWTYVDNYGETSGSEINSSSLSYDFKNNSTRLRIADNHVEIPIIYEKGFIVFRARGVGIWDKDIKQTIEGLWTLEDEATGILPVSFGIFKIDDGHAHEKDRMNWKHMVQYDDQGNRKDVVEYMDGSLRTRQSVSQINSEDMLIVGETLYDHQGRPAISVLPAPYKPPGKPNMDLVNYVNAGDIQAHNFGDRIVEENLKRSRISDFLNNSSIGGSTPSGGTPPPGSGTFPTPGGTPELAGLSYDFSNPDLMIPERISEGLREDMLDGIPLPGQIYNSSRPKISYQPNFNLNNARHPYDRRNFDLESPEDCEISAEPMDTWRGASNYYSPYNPDKSIFNAYIPDAKRYPFTHLQYTPDKTGRVRKQGGLGPDFQIGSDHEQKLFYAVPSQFELDRLFGTDVGYAQHYKKQISIDPNGQASLSFTDLRGNTIATALTGPSPENLEQIDEYEELNITLDLLSEKSVLPEGSYSVDNRSIETSKTLYLSRPTEVRLNYRLLSESYVDNTCPTAICYECAYDLDVYIVDDCGETKYRLSQTIGSLIGTNSCNPVSFDRDGSVRLDAGIYTVVRKLSVSAEAIAQRLVLFRENSRCLLPRRDELPTDDTPYCDPPCNVCEYSTVDVEVFLAATIPGITRPRSLILPVEFVNGGSADCRTFCPGSSISELGTTRMMMLNDVSPMGQYALYVENPRIYPDPSPLGHVNPGAFPLSILNVSNRLPIQNANWKNPAIPYRDADGNNSLIRINDDMLPAHSAEHRELIGGNYYVRPQYLDDVEDFINNWKTSWAESLIIYHPEYQHYLWMRDHRADYEQNTLMQQIETYDDARVNYINHISRSYVNDRFIFRNRSVAEPIADRIFRNYTPFPDGRMLNLDETIYMIVNCNNVNFTNDQLYDCANDHPLYTDIRRQDIEWKYYRDLYLAGKKKVMDEVRELALALGYIDHNSIGSEGSLYHDKQKRIMSSSDLLDILADDIEYADPSALLSSLAARANQQMLNRCGICPLGSQFLALLNGFAHEGRLLETVSLPDAPPLVLTRDLVDAFTVKTALYYQWVPRADRDVLTVSFQTGGREVC